MTEAASTEPSKERAKRDLVAADEGEARAADPRRIHLHMPVDVRSLSLIVLTALACIFALQWAKAVLVPLLLGVVFSYALTPAVDRLQRWYLPRIIGASVVLGAIMAVIGWGMWALGDQASALIETLPNVAQKVRQGLEGQHPKSESSPFDRVQQAANVLEQAAQAAAGSPSASAASGARGTAARAAPALGPIETTPPRSVTRVVVEKPGFNVRDYLWSGTLGLFVFLGQVAIVLFVTLFLLASGDTFRRKMVKLAGPRLSQKKITIQALDEISVQIQRYLLVQLATSVVVGTTTGLAFYALGLHNAAVWGVAAGITNLVPYLGAVFVGLGSAVVGFIQFDSLHQALFIGLSSFAIHGIVGNLLTPWWTGRASRMSPFAVFVGVLAFGWLWGAVGLILGTPILMAVKTVCDRVDELKPVGEFLGA
ncbi:MAG TPA: AI-2E family transporter [Caldimonas sp.]|jgi:predicted PurR-regulated permease PerM|nr:AI-2E family transporter [Caldimonas sp.]HEX4232987.1 AI-2E family transporter [Caldimonas sp.]